MLVSVIVPVYNTEEYLPQCIESILNQTWKEIQLILVDDGSADRSYQICLEYASRHPNIEVYHQENRGVSAARNTALDHLRGEYVFFVDSDDFVQPTFIEDLMAVGDYPYIGAGYTEESASHWQCHAEDCVISMNEYKSNAGNHHRVPSVHVIGNRYARSIIENHHVRFDEAIRIGEDLRFNVEYFSHIDVLRAVDQCSYMYRMREGSAIHSFWPDRLEEERGEAQARETLLGGSEDFDMIKYIHWHIAMEHYYQYTGRTSDHRQTANQKLAEAVWDPYFRQAIPWIIRNGSKDMVLEAICVKLGSYKLYKSLWAGLLRVRSLIMGK